MANHNLTNEQQENLRKALAEQFQSWLAHPISVALLDAIDAKRRSYYRLAEEAAYSGDEKKACLNLLAARTLGMEIELVKNDQRK